VDGEEQSQPLRVEADPTGAAALIAEEGAEEEGYREEKKDKPRVDY
jgi:hypothetical protein